MIATVRIAPMEQWCKTYRADAPVEKTIGLAVEIIPESMTDEQAVTWRGECGGKWWAITNMSGNKIAELIGGPPPTHLCEHMLEMD